MDDEAASGRDAGLGGAGQRDPASVEPGIRTFLIADIRGYTRFTNERGDEAAGRLTSQFAAVTEQVVVAHGGVVLELRGDEALAVFASARQAIRTAVALQRSFTQPPPDEEFALPVGIGLDAGEAVPLRGGFRGASLNRAARLCSLAAAGQVLATPEVVHLASRVDGTRFVPYGQVRLKGLPHPVDVITIEAEDRRDHPSYDLHRLAGQPVRRRGAGGDGLFRTVICAVGTRGHLRLTRGSQHLARHRPPAARHRRGAGTLRTYVHFLGPNSVVPGPKGLVRTPQSDDTANEIRQSARLDSKLCR